MLMAFLPLAGLPISLFLFFLGVKFGLVKGLLLLAVLMLLTCWLPMGW
ncbi:MAG: hypothetical protein R2860_09470 [Desulfobacterales bacterium]